MECSKCGKKLKKGDLFCNGCGAKVKKTNSKENNTKKKEGLITASIVIGIIAILFSVVLNILILPLAILGLIFGIVGKSTKGKKIAGIVTNSIAIVVGIIMFSLLIVLLASIANDSDNAFNNTFKKIVSAGDEEKIHNTWKCKATSSGVITNNNYTLTLKFTNDGKFDWRSYINPSRNYVIGDYDLKKPYKLDDSKDRYYEVVLKPKTMYLYGIRRTPSETKYNLYPGDSDKDTIKLVNQKTNNTYYCDED